MKTVHFVLVAVLAAGPAFAAEPAPKPEAAKPAKAAPAEPKDDSEKLICTREKSTDSFMSKRVCKTKAQIEAERQASRQLQEQRDVLSNRTDIRP